METVKTTYIGGFRTEAIHVKSGQTIITDAPVDNNGKGEAFSPTDLVAAALASCMITLMDITATGKGFSLGNVEAKTTKIMAADPRRISSLVLDFDLSAKQYSQREKQILEVAARNCPVAKSIHPDIELEVTFRF